MRESDGLSEHALGDARDSADEHPIEATNGLRKVEDVVNRLEMMIMEGVLIPGQRLIEAELMCQLGVTRSPLREALRILSGKGIVELVPRKGARIYRYSTQDVVSVIQLLGAIFRQTIEILKESPGSLDGYRPNLAAVIQDLRTAQLNLDIMGMYQCEIRYQEILFEACGNNRFASVMSGMRPVLHGFAISNVWDSKLIVRCANLYADIDSAIANEEWEAAIGCVHELVEITILSARNTSKGYLKLP